MTAVIVLAILAVGAGWFLWSHLKEMQAEDLERELIRRKGTKDPDQSDLDRASDEGMSHPDDGMR